MANHCRLLFTALQCVFTSMWCCGWCQMGEVTKSFTHSKSIRWIKWKFIYCSEQGYLFKKKRNAGKNYSWTSDRTDYVQWTKIMEDITQQTLLDLFTDFFTMKILHHTVQSYCQTKCGYPQTVSCMTKNYFAILQRVQLQMRCLLLLLAFGLPVHHLPEAGQNLAFSLPPLLLIEGCQCSLFISTVDLVFLSQTHSLHTTMSAGLSLRLVRIIRMRTSVVSENTTNYWIAAVQIQIFIVLLVTIVYLLPLIT